MATNRFKSPQPLASNGTPLTRADYDYEVTADHIVVIEDLDLGNMSVTNDAENVLADIARRERLPSLAGYRVVYLDSLKNWDGMRLDARGRFVDFYSLGGQTPTVSEALRKIRALG